VEVTETQVVEGSQMDLLEFENMTRVVNRIKEALRKYEVDQMYCSCLVPQCLRSLHVESPAVGRGTMATSETENGRGGPRNSEADFFFPSRRVNPDMVTQFEATATASTPIVRGPTWYRHYLLKDPRIRAARQSRHES